MNRVYRYLFAALCFFPTLLMAQDESAPPRDSGAWQGLIMIAIAFAFFYFIVWRPEQRRRKDLEVKRSGLQKGDRVTAMGIIGTVARVDEHTVILKMVDGAKIEVIKAAINEVTSGGGEEAKKNLSD